MFRKIATVIVVLTFIATTGIAATSPQWIEHDQKMFTSVYGLEQIDLTVTSSAKSVTMIYRNLDCLTWSSAVMVGEGKEFQASIRTDVIVPPGVEYYFEANGVKTETYKVFIVYDPIEGGPGALRGAGDEYAYDLQYHNGYLPNGKRVTWQAMSPVNAYTAVNSKLMEIRNLSDVIHKGVDLNTPMYTPVYAMSDGTLEFVNEVRTNAAGVYVFIAHNANGTRPVITSQTTPFIQDLYSHYFHLDSIAINPATGQKWQRGDQVTKGQLIAMSGNTPNPLGKGIHLDFGFDWYSSSTSARRCLPAKYFFPSLGSNQWDSGDSLDFVQPPTFFFDSATNTMKVTVNAFAHDDGGVVKTDLVVKLMMGYGQPTFEVPMTQDSINKKLYYATLSGRGYDGSTVNAYIKAERPTISTTRFVTRPLQKDSAPPTVYYSVPVICPPRVSSPNGGESWQNFSTYPITWTTGAIGGNVKIELSVNGGGSWQTITSSTPNNGYFSWYISGISPTSQARIRVTSLTYPSCFDVSDSNFSITDATK